MRLDMSGASRVTLAGSARRLDLRESGPSMADLGAFGVTDASVRMSGGSRATIITTGSLSYDLSGASDLTYLGPRIGRSRQSGGSQARAE